MSVVEQTSQPNVMLAALRYASLGFRVVPIAPAAKAPLLRDWPNRASNDPADLRLWWGKRPDAGVGLVMGTQSDGSAVIAVDIDNHNPAELGADTIRDLELAYGDLPDTWRQITGSGGQHILLRVPDGLDIRNDAGKLLGPGVDIRANGGQIIAAPTIHPNGRPYEWEDGNAPWDIPIADAPGWIIGLLTARSDGPKERPAAPYEGQTRPGDRWAAATPWKALLEADGAQYLATHKDGHEFWARPGIAGDHTSASLYYKGSEVLYCFTPNWPGLEQNQSYTKLGYLAATRFGGDHSEAARWLVEQGHGSDDQDDYSDLITPGIAGTTHAAPQANAGSHLPEEFWEARPLYRQIRQAAWSRVLAADAVFGAVLVRAAFQTDHRVILPAIVGRYGSLNLMAGIVGPSGTGKGSAADTATEFLGRGQHAVGYRTLEVSAGSGEGIIRSFSEKVQTGEKGSKTSEFKRTIQGLYIRVDEGEVLGQLGGRNGSTLWSVWRSGWTGEKLGFTNASQERRYPPVEARSYRLCALVGIQPTLAGEILADSDGGTPQRFLWFSTTDPAIPDTAPLWPGAVDWTPPRWDTGTVTTIERQDTCLIDVDPAIVAELRAAQRAKVAGTGTTDMDSHRGLNKLKVAAVLAVLDGRYNIGLEDWDLAAIVLDTSDAVREATRETIAVEARRAEERQIDLHGRKAAADETARRGASADVERVVQRLKRVVSNADGPVSRRDLANSVASRDRRVFESALQVALALGVLIDDGTGRFERGGRD
jgi:hypothetical protein